MKRYDRSMSDRAVCPDINSIPAAASRRMPAERGDEERGRRKDGGGWKDGGRRRRGGEGEGERKGKGKREGRGGREGGRSSAKREREGNSDVSIPFKVLAFANPHFCT